MKSIHLLDELEFHETVPFAQPLFVDQSSRILRWTLKPGQKVDEHKVPDSPFYVVILKGRGIFAGADGQEQEYGAHDLLLFEQGEIHAVRALDEELVFISFLQGTETMRSDRIGGELGRN